MTRKRTEWPRRGLAGLAVLALACSTGPRAVEDAATPATPLTPDRLREAACAGAGPEDCPATFCRVVSHLCSRPGQGCSFGRPVECVPRNVYGPPGYLCLVHQATGEVCSNGEWAPAPAPGPWRACTAADKDPRFSLPRCPATPP